MPIPGRLLVHSVTRVRPAPVVDSCYGTTTWDYGVAATRTAGIRAWLQQNDTTESFGDRDLIDQRWLQVTNEADWRVTDRVEWSGHPSGQLVTFAIDGVPEPAYTPRGFDHMEIGLRIQEG
jgi:hypothetical protein